MGGASCPKGGWNSNRVRHRIEPRHHDIALGLVNTHGHVEMVVMQFLGQHLGVAMQPADAGPVGGLDRQVQRNPACRQPIFDRGQQRLDSLAGFGRDQETRPLRRAARGDIAEVLALLRIETVDLVPDFEDARAGIGIDTE